MVCERLSDNICLIKSFEKNQERIGHPLIDFFSQKEPQWKLDGVKTSREVDDWLYKNIWALFERKIEDSKKRVNVREFNEFYELTSPYSRIRSFLDHPQKRVGSLINFKLYSLEKGDTDAFQLQKYWNTTGESVSVYALTANYITNLLTAGPLINSQQRQKGVVASFFDLSLCSARDDRLKKAKMKIVDYVEVSPGSEIELGRLVRQDGYVIRKMKFYTGKEFFTKKR